jgi:hypothetical protein
MAYYDFETDKIYGCKKYSITWWHERGHQILHRKDWYAEFTRLYHPMILIFVIACLVAQDYSLAKISLLIYLAFIFFDEIFAWIYCIIHKQRWK